MMRSIVLAFGVALILLGVVAFGVQSANYRQSAWRHWQSTWPSAAVVQEKTPFLLLGGGFIAFTAAKLFKPAG